MHAELPPLTPGAYLRRVTGPATSYCSGVSLRSGRTTSGRGPEDPLWAGDAKKNSLSREPARLHGGQMILTDGDQPAAPERDANQPSGHGTPAVPGTLIEAIAKAHRWQACPAIADRRRRKQIEAGQYAGIEDLAQAVGVGRTYVGRTCPPKPSRRRVLRLTSLAPDIIEAILRGDEPEGMSLGKLRRGLPVRWEEQRKTCMKG